MRRILTLSLIFSLALIHSCKKEEKGPAGTGNKVELTTRSVTYSSGDSAICGGEITKDGMEFITARGVCWSTSSNPTVSNSNKSIDGTGMGLFTSRIRALIPARVYYVRAYATNIHGTVYGDQKSFQTAAARPTLTTNAASSISYTAAIAGGTIVSDGGSAVTKTGICYSSTNNLPDTFGSKITGGAATASFSLPLNGLNPGTLYYARAFAINSMGLSYASNVINFRTQAVQSPTVSITCPVNTSQITYTSAVCAGTVSSNGGATVVQTGFCYSTSNTSPSITNSPNVTATGTTTFSATLSNLTAGTTYYVRAFALNSGNGTPGYSTVCSFTTRAIQAPTVTATCGGSASYTTATVSGNVTSDGGSTITDRGICYSSSTTAPTTSNAFVSGGTGTGVFSVNLSNLAAGITYYYRAYVKSSAYPGNTFYSSNVCSFTTLSYSTPTCLTSCTASSVTNSSASLSGSVTADGGAPVTDRGIVYSNVTSAPTVGNSTAISGGTGLGSFVVSASNLSPGTTYYYRTYARNSGNVNYGYGNICSFTTLTVLPPTVLTVSPATSITSTSAVASGNVTADGGATVTSRGICYSATNPNPSVTDNVIYASTGGLGSYSVTLTPLASYNTYYYRAFAKNSLNANYAYGTVYSFTTSLAAPTLTAPANGSAPACCYLYFTWQGVNNASQYEIQISKSSTFTGTIYSISSCSSIPSTTGVNRGYTTSSPYCMNLGSTLQNGIWYWRVRATANGGAVLGPWSSTWYYSYTF